MTPIPNTQYPIPNLTITVIANAKGGVAKTTTAISLATGLAALGHNTLLIDLDSQPGNATVFLGIARGPGLFNLIVAKRPPRECITPIPTYSKLGLIASDNTTLTVNTVLSSPALETPLKDALRARLEPLSGNGALHVILDTAPSLSHLQVAALGAADYLLVPTTPEYAAEAGVNQIAHVTSELQAQGSKLRLLGVIPSMIDRRTTEHKNAVAEMKAAFGDLLYPEIGRTLKLGEAPRQGKPIWSHAPRSRAARDYACILRRYLEDVGLQ
jgi:chromosome partitioning protein